MKDKQITKDEAIDKDFLTFSLSDLDLKELGLGDIAYIKEYFVEGKKAFVLHAADGVALDVQSSESAAVNNAHYQDLNLVALH